MGKDHLIHDSNRSREIFLPKDIGGRFFLIDLQSIKDFEINEAVKILDPIVVEKANRKKFAKDQNPILLTHFFLKSLLGIALDCNPKSVTIKYKSSGKPYVENQSIQFSLAYGENYSLIAIHEEKKIGVDIERIREVDHTENLTKLFMHPNEVIQFNESKNKQSYFFCLWSLKEAFLKAKDLHFDNLKTYDFSHQLNLPPEEKVSDFYFSDQLIPHHSFAVYLST